LKKNEADIREEKLDAKLETLAKTGDWEGVLQALDVFDANNERRHGEHRAGMDAAIVERDPGEREWYDTADLLKLSRSSDWLDIIFSRRPEDIAQLVEEYPVSAALRELTPIQKRVLFMNIVHGIPVKDIAAVLGCSIRNVTKHRQKALEAIRFLVTGEP